jgi:hypothetical protein
MYDRPADYYFATPELRVKLILASECPTTVNKSDGRTSVQEKRIPGDLMAHIVISPTIDTIRGRHATHRSSIHSHSTPTSRILAAWWQAYGLHI